MIFQSSVEMIEEYESPFFKWCEDNNAHWDAGIRGMVEIAGLAKRYSRYPFDHLTDAQIESLKQFLKDKKVI